MAILVRPGWAVTMDEAYGVVERPEIVVDGADIIEVRREHTLQVSEGTEVLDLPWHVALPGLVNCHTHVAGCVFRAVTEDPTDSFYGLALPTEKYLTAARVRSFSELGILECLLAGCTTLNDMYHFAAETVCAAAEFGVRLQIASKTYDTDVTRLDQGRFATQELADQRLAENVALYESFHESHDGRIRVRFGAHAADTCSPGLLAGIRSEAESRGAGTHIHVAQSPKERDFMHSHYGLGSIEFLDREGFLGPGAVLAHCVYVSGSEVATLAASGSGMAHCPEITAKRGRFAPMRDIYESGALVGWGTDWVSMDPWQVMRAGITISRVHFEDISMLSAREALHHMTLGSAAVLGIGEQVGSLTPGKKADLILVDADQPHLAPMVDPVTTLVYNATGNDVTHVMVNGQLLVKDREPTKADLPAILRSARLAAEEVWSAAGIR